MFQKILSLTVIVCFFLTSLSPICPVAFSADNEISLPAPGTMVNLSPSYEPAMIKGLTVHKDNPFLFDFILDTGNSGIAGDELKKEGDRLVKYFFACLTIPEKDLWVNLSPYEKDKIVPQALGQTALGRDLLAQDYILKQLTASLINPEKDLGKAFWDRVYAKARQMYGTTQIPVNTFNKVWIVADKANVYEHGQTAFVKSGHLKVMLEEDYLALNKSSPLSTVIPAKAGIHDTTHSLASQIVKEIILPEIENEVNTGKNFSTLRQIFNSLILASWYKKELKEALLNQVYANKSTVKGVNLADPSVKEIIYQQYLKAYKKGVFNYIKEDALPDGQTIPRKYFSGGFKSNLAMTVDNKPVDAAGIAEPTGKDFRFTVGLNINNPVNAAMLTGVAKEFADSFDGLAADNREDMLSRAFRWSKNTDLTGEKLIEILNTTDPEHDLARQGAVTLLGSGERIGFVQSNRDAWDTIVKHALDVKNSDNLRLSSLKALVSINWKAAKPFLIEVLSSNDLSPVMKREIIDYFIDKNSRFKGDPKLVETLRKVYETDPDVRDVAKEALRLIAPEVLESENLNLGSVLSILKTNGGDSDGIKKVAILLRYRRDLINPEVWALLKKHSFTEENRGIEAVPRVRLDCLKTLYLSFPLNAKEYLLDSIVTHVNRYSVTNVEPTSFVRRDVIAVMRREVDGILPFQGNTSVIDALNRVKVNDPSEEVRIAAEETLEKLNPSVPASFLKASASSAMLSDTAQEFVRNFHGVVDRKGLISTAFSWAGETKLNLQDLMDILNSTGQEGVPTRQYTVARQGAVFILGSRERKESVRGNELVLNTLVQHALDPARNGLEDDEDVRQDSLKTLAILDMKKEKPYLIDAISSKEPSTKVNNGIIEYMRNHPLIFKNDLKALRALKAAYETSGDEGVKLNAKRVLLLFAPEALESIDLNLDNVLRVFRAGDAAERKKVAKLLRYRWDLVKTNEVWEVLRMHSFRIAAGGLEEVPGVRSSCLKTLYLSDPQKAKVDLLNSIKDQVELFYFVRRDVIMYMGNPEVDESLPFKGDEEVINALKYSRDHENDLHDPYRQVKTVAIKALEQLDQAQIFKPGGIDLNSTNMGMTVARDTNGGVQINIDPAMIARIKAQGVFSADPIIIRITPISSAQISPLLGLQ